MLTAQSSSPQSMFTPMNSQALGPFGFIGEIFNSVMGPLMTGLNNMVNKAEQLQAEKRSVKYWEMENAYNAPVQQVARLREAGINPAAVYGSVANHNTNSNMPARAQAANVQNMFRAIANPVTLMQQIEAQQLQNEQQRFELFKQQQLLPQQLDAIKFQNALTLSDVQNKYKLTPFQMEMLLNQIDYYNSYTKERSKIDLQNWKTFGTSDVPWYLKVGNNILTGLNFNF